MRKSDLHRASKAIVSPLLSLAGVVWMAQTTGEGRAQSRTRWEAPEAARALKNPVPSSEQALSEGRDLFRKNCLTCHGPTGKGDGPASQFIHALPADLSQPAAQERMTDGEIFWKVTEGRDPMPPFEKKITEDERWKLVHYVRSLRAH